MRRREIAGSNSPSREEGKTVPLPHLILLSLPSLPDASSPRHAIYKVRPIVCARTQGLPLASWLSGLRCWLRACPESEGRVGGELCLQQVCLVLTSERKPFEPVSPDEAPLPCQPSPPVSSVPDARVLRSLSLSLCRLCVWLPCMWALSRQGWLRTVGSALACPGCPPNPTSSWQLASMTVSRVEKAREGQGQGMGAP